MRVEVAGVRAAPASSSHFAALRERAHGDDGLVLALGDDREEAAVAHDLQHAGHLLHRGALSTDSSRAP